MIFVSRGISTVRDVLTFFPRAYEDRTKMAKVDEVEEGAVATLPLTVVGTRKIPMRGRGRMMLEVRCEDSGGSPLILKYFYVPRGLEAKFTAGAQLIVTGPVKKFMNRPEIVHPEITWGASAAPDLPMVAPQAGSATSVPARDFGRVVPIYVEIEGVPSRALRKVLWEALERYSGFLSEDLPERSLIQHALPRLAPAIRSIHFPDEERVADLLAFNTPAHWRLVYEEFFKFEYLVLRQRMRAEKEAAPSIGDAGGREASLALEKILPFPLTGDQTKVIAEVLADLAKPHPMNRLVQGDVGSGKTAVAFLTSGAVLAEGGQVTLMAPTEILAEQHFKNAIKLFGGRLNVALLTGKTSTGDRAKLLSRLKSGEPMLLIGTHALLEDSVKFANLQFVLIDEQHRFGVEQRRVLRSKGTRSEIDRVTGLTQIVLPHTLILTATPIPRTLALTAYGDLAVSSVREMPPGRAPVKTQVIRGDARVHAYEKIRSELQKGHQAFFIYPLVNDSEAEGFTELRSAVSEAERLAADVFPEFKVGLLHGQLKADDKARIMDQFARNELQILVSTTVIEVGVDVPNSTVMAVEHSERFGLSQLHQLRGRVGRGQAQSYCFFFASRKTGENTTARLEVLEETTDGFKIAEADLEIRGPGEFLGTRQAGSLPFKLAHLVRDRDWLLKARDDAALLLSEDADLMLPENRSLREYFIREGKLQSDRLKTS